MAVRHIEPEHVRKLPVPLLPEHVQRKIHGKIVRAWKLREKANKLEEAVKHLAENGFEHVTTISGVDIGDGIEVVYHLTRRGRGGTTLSLKVKTDMENPSLPTISGIIPGASIYEREAHDLFGIVFRGHPNPAPLLLPDGWPKDIHPLLKKWKAEEIRRRLTKNEGK